MRDLSGEHDGRAGDRSDSRRAGAVQECLDGLVRAQSVKPRPADQDEHERGSERDRRREQAAAEPGRGVSDDGDGLDDGAGRDLAQRHCVEELRVRHPVVVVDRVGAHQRNDDESAAIRQRANFDGDPGQRTEAAGRCVQSDGRDGRCRFVESAPAGSEPRRCRQAISTRTTKGPRTIAAAAPAAA